jgi:Family of unknown function (DUF6335)
MAKKSASRRAKSGKKTHKRKPAARRATKTKKVTSKARKPASKARKAVSKPKKAVKRAKKPRKAAPPPILPTKAPRLDRVRRTLNDDVVNTPPSSLDMERHGSAAGSGRAGMEQHRRQHGQMNSVTTGDPDVNVDNAYFSGDEAPGGDNPTPDQDIVDDIGKALGVQYNDDEELKSGDKLKERDKHRWELNPASSEDYKERD